MREWYASNGNEIPFYSFIIQWCDNAGVLL
jgi:hypothetical protein